MIVTLTLRIGLLLGMGCQASKPVHPADEVRGVKEAGLQCGDVGKRVKCEHY